MGERSTGEGEGCAPSPLTGAYLLVVLPQPHLPEHKDAVLHNITKGFLSWDKEDCHVDLEKELQIITSQAPEGEEARNGERLIQFASENLVTEVLIHPQLNTLVQCIRNLLSSFTRHRHIIHAGYTYIGNGSWILQDGTFSFADFLDMFQEIEVQRVLRAYENTVTIDIHCSQEGDWSNLRNGKEPFSKLCRVRLNPNDKLSGSEAIHEFLDYLSGYLVPASIEHLLEPSDVVGNIRFSHPTLYVFPGGQGDAALFGINGFNMLVDGGFSRKACFWDFIRHLDRLDAVLMTRLNNGNLQGIASFLYRKRLAHVYPQIGHFFCNLQERRQPPSPDGDKDKDPLLVNLIDQGQDIVSSLRQLNLKPQACHRDMSLEPINLYHKVGHGKLDMYVLSPAKDSREVKEFVSRWNASDTKLFSSYGKKPGEFNFPLYNRTSICALLVWQPANPNDNITRLLFPGSAPQEKIFEGLDKLKNLEFMRHAVCSAKSLSPSSSTMGLNIRSVTKPKGPSVIEKLPTSEVKQTPKTIETVKSAVKSDGTAPTITEAKSKQQPAKHIKPKTDKTKEHAKTDVDNIADHIKPEKQKTQETAPKKSEKPKDKPRKIMQRQSEKKSQKPAEKKADSLKSSPTTPKKSVEAKVNGVEPKHRAPSKTRISPSATPAKSAKEENNRKVVESKTREVSRPHRGMAGKKDDAKKIERRTISKRPQTTSPSKAVGKPSSPVKAAVPRGKKDIRKVSKTEKELTTDSSTVSTPSTVDADLGAVKPKEVAEKDKEIVVDESKKEVEKTDEKIDGEAEIAEKKDEVKQPEAPEEALISKEEEDEILIIEKVEIGEPEVGTTKDSIEMHLQKAKEEALQEKLDEPKKVTEPAEELTDRDKIIDSAEKDEKSGATKETVTPESEPVQEEVRDIVRSAAEIPSAPKLDAIKGETQITAEDHKVVSKEKVPTAKDEVPDQKMLADESQPDEKFSTTVESGATTAPTLPEDERIPLDEIKEGIEEKYVKEKTKEKDTGNLQKPEQPTSLPQVSIVPGNVFEQKMSQYLRDIVKTPDEVADLPVHEEVDAGIYEGSESGARELTRSKEDLLSLPPVKRQVREEAAEATEELKFIKDGLEKEDVNKDLKEELEHREEDKIKLEEKKDTAAEPERAEAPAKKETEIKGPEIGQEEKEAEIITTAEEKIKDIEVQPTKTEMKIDEEPVKETAAEMVDSVARPDKSKPESPVEELQKLADVTGKDMEEKMEKDRVIEKKEEDLKSPLEVTSEEEKIIEKGLKEQKEGAEGVDDSVKDKDISKLKEVELGQVPVAAEEKAAAIEADLIKATKPDEMSPITAETSITSVNEAELDKIAEKNEAEALRATMASKTEEKIEKPTQIGEKFLAKGIILPEPEKFTEIDKGKQVEGKIPDVEELREDVAKVLETELPEATADRESRREICDKDESEMKVEETVEKPKEDIVVKELAEEKEKVAKTAPCETVDEKSITVDDEKISELISETSVVDKHVSPEKETAQIKTEEKAEVIATVEELKEKEIVDKEKLPEKLETDKTQAEKEEIIEEAKKIDKPLGRRFDEVPAVAFGFKPDDEAIDDRAQEDIPASKLPVGVLKESDTTEMKPAVVPTVAGKEIYVKPELEKLPAKETSVIEDETKEEAVVTKPEEIAPATASVIPTEIIDKAKIDEAVKETEKVDEEVKREAEKVDEIVKKDEEKVKEVEKKDEAKIVEDVKKDQKVEEVEKKQQPKIDEELKKDEAKEEVVKKEEPKKVDQEAEKVDEEIKIEEAKVVEVIKKEPKVEDVEKKEEPKFGEEVKKVEMKKEAVVEETRVEKEVKKDAAKVEDGEIKEEPKADEVMKKEEMKIEGVLREEEPKIDEVVKEEVPKFDHVEKAKEICVEEEVKKEELKIPEVQKKDELKIEEVKKVEGEIEEGAKKEAKAEEALKKEEITSEVGKKEEATVKEELKKEEPKIEELEQKEESKIEDLLIKEEAKVEDVGKKDDVKVTDKKEEHKMEEVARKEGDKIDELVKKEESKAEVIVKKEESKIEDVMKDESKTEEIERKEEAKTEGGKEEVPKLDEITKKDEAKVDEVVKKEELKLDEEVVKEKMKVDEAVTKEEQKIEELAKKEEPKLDEVVKKDESKVEEAVKEEKAKVDELLKKGELRTEELAKTEEPKLDEVVKKDETKVDEEAKVEEAKVDEVLKKEELKIEELAKKVEPKFDEVVKKDEPKIDEAAKEEEAKSDELLKQEDLKVEKLTKKEELKLDEVMKKGEPKIDEEAKVEEAKVDEVLKKEELKIAELAKKEEPKHDELVKEDEPKVDEMLKKDEPKIENILKKEDLKMEEVLKKDEPMVGVEVVKKEEQKIEHAKEEDLKLDEAIKKDEPKVDEVLKKDEPKVVEVLKKDELKIEEVSKKDEPKAEEMVKKAEMKTEELKKDEPMLGGEVAKEEEAKVDEVVKKEELKIELAKEEELKLEETMKKDELKVGEVLKKDETKVEGVVKKEELKIEEVSKKDELKLEESVKEEELKMEEVLKKDETKVSEIVKEEEPKVEDVVIKEELKIEDDFSLKKDEMKVVEAMKTDESKDEEVVKEEELKIEEVSKKDEPDISQVLKKDEAEVEEVIKKEPKVDEGLEKGKPKVDAIPIKEETKIEDVKHESEKPDEVVIKKAEIVAAVEKTEADVVEEVPKEADKFDDIVKKEEEKKEVCKTEESIKEDIKKVEVVQKVVEEIEDVKKGLDKADDIVKKELAKEDEVEEKEEPKIEELVKQEADKLDEIDKIEAKPEEGVKKEDTVAEEKVTKEADKIKEEEKVTEEIKIETGKIDEVAKKEVEKEAEKIDAISKKEVEKIEEVIKETEMISEVLQKEAETAAVVEMKKGEKIEEDLKKEIEKIDEDAKKVQNVDTIATKEEEKVDELAKKQVEKVEEEVKKEADKFEKVGKKEVDTVEEEIEKGTEKVDEVSKKGEQKVEEEVTKEVDEVAKKEIEKLEEDVTKKAEKMEESTKKEVRMIEEEFKKVADTIDVVGTEGEKVDLIAESVVQGVEKGAENIEAEKKEVEKVEDEGKKLEEKMAEEGKLLPEKVDEEMKKEGDKPIEVAAKDAVQADVAAKKMEETPKPEEENVDELVAKKEMKTDEGKDDEVLKKESPTDTDVVVKPGVPEIKGMDDAKATEELVTERDEDKEKATDSAKKTIDTELKKTADDTQVETDKSDTESVEKSAVVCEISQTKETVSEGKKTGDEEEKEMVKDLSGPTDEVVSETKVEALDDIKAVKDTEVTKEDKAKQIDHFATEIKDKETEKIDAVALEVERGKELDDKLATGTKEKLEGKVVTEEKEEEDKSEDKEKADSIITKTEDKDKLDKLVTEDKTTLDVKDKTGDASMESKEKKEDDKVAEISEKEDMEASKVTTEKKDSTLEPVSSQMEGQGKPIKDELADPTKEKTDGKDIKEMKPLDSKEKPKEEEISKIEEKREKKQHISPADSEETGKDKVDEVKEMKVEAQKVELEKDTKMITPPSEKAEEETKTGKGDPINKLPALDSASEGKDSIEKQGIDLGSGDKSVVPRTDETTKTLPDMEVELQTEKDKLKDKPDDKLSVVLTATLKEEVTGKGSAETGIVVADSIISSKEETSGEVVKEEVSKPIAVDLLKQKEESIDEDKNEIKDISPADRQMIEAVAVKELEKVFTTAAFMQPEIKEKEVIELAKTEEIEKSEIETSEKAPRAGSKPEPPVEKVEKVSDSPQTIDESKVDGIKIEDKGAATKTVTGLTEKTSAESKISSASDELEKKVEKHKQEMDSVSKTEDIKEAEKHSVTASSEDEVPSLPQKVQELETATKDILEQKDVSEQIVKDEKKDMVPEKIVIDKKMSPEKVPKEEKTEEETPVGYIAGTEDVKSTTPESLQTESKDVKVKEEALKDASPADSTDTKRSLSPKDEVQEQKAKDDKKEDDQTTCKDISKLEDQADLVKDEGKEVAVSKPGIEEKGDKKVSEAAPESEKEEKESLLPSDAEKTTSTKPTDEKILDIKESAIKYETIPKDDGITGASKVDDIVITKKEPEETKTGKDEKTVEEPVIDKSKTEDCSKDMSQLIPSDTSSQQIKKEVTPTELDDRVLLEDQESLKEKLQTETKEKDDKDVSELPKEDISVKDSLTKQLGLAGEESTSTEKPDKLGAESEVKIKGDEQSLQRPDKIQRPDEKESDVSKEEKKGAECKAEEKRESLTEKVEIKDDISESKYITDLKTKEHTDKSKFEEELSSDKIKELEKSDDFPGSLKDEISPEVTKGQLEEKECKPDKAATETTSAQGQLQQVSQQEKDVKTLAETSRSSPMKDDEKDVDAFLKEGPSTKSEGKSLSMKEVSIDSGISQDEISIEDKFKEIGVEEKEDIKLAGDSTSSQQKGLDTLKLDETIKSALSTTSGAVAKSEVVKMSSEKDGDGGIKQVDDKVKEESSKTEGQKPESTLLASKQEPASVEERPKETASARTPEIAQPIQTGSSNGIAKDTNGVTSRISESDRPASSMAHLADSDVKAKTTNGHSIYEEEVKYTTKVVYPGKISDSITIDVSKAIPTKEITETRIYKTALSKTSSDKMDIKPVMEFKTMEKQTAHEDIKSEGEGVPLMCTVSELRKEYSRSVTPGSDAVSEKEYDLGGHSTPQSDISSGQVSRAATHMWESSEGRQDSQHYDSDEDIPGSPMSITSHIHSPPQFDYDIHRGKESAMTGSFYGSLPEEEPLESSVPDKGARSKVSSMYSSMYVTKYDDKSEIESSSGPTNGKQKSEMSSSVILPEKDLDIDFQTAIKEHKLARGEDLSQRSKEDEAGKEGKKGVNGAQASGKEPESKSKQDPIEDWGKPLGLPPAPRRARCLEWDPTEEWGHPMGLPSPAPPPSKDESNGDIEVELVPASAKTTPKKVAKMNAENNKIASNTTAGKEANNKTKRSESPVKRANKDSRKANITPIYMDLSYVPHHGNSHYANVEFFKRVRARYYVFSGTEPSKEVFNALLEAKQTWEEKDLEVTIIPTYDTDTLGYWITENEDILAKYKIDLSPSASRCTINLQDHETSCSAYRLEF